MVPSDSPSSIAYAERRRSELGTRRRILNQRTRACRAYGWIDTRKTGGSEATRRTKTKQRGGQRTLKERWSVVLAHRQAHASRRGDPAAKADVIYLEEMEGRRLLCQCFREAQMALLPLLRFESVPALRKYEASFLYVSSMKRLVA